MSQPAFVFDFDGVIADTARLKEAIFETVAQEGFAKEEIESVYEAVKRERGGQDPVEFSRRLAGDEGQISERVLSAWMAGEKRITEMVSQEMVTLVRSLREAGYPTILLTAGRPEVQQRKVTNAGMEEGTGGPFDKVIYVEEDGAGENKMDEIRKLLDEHAFLVLFDDQPYNIAPFASNFPRDRVLPVFVRIFADSRNADYVPPEGVPTLSSPEYLTVPYVLSLLPQP